MPIRNRLLFCPILLMLLPRPDANIAHANKLRRIREEGTTKSTPSPLAGYRPKSIELQSTSSEPDAEPSSAIQSPVNMPINEPTSFSTPKYSKQPRSLSSKSNQNRVIDNGATSISPRSTTHQCTNTPGFIDMYGDECNYYESNVPLLCLSYGNDGEPGMMTANENCCVCKELQRPNTTDSQSPCIDTPGYLDIYGDDCDYYEAEENYPQACQDFGTAGYAGLTPNENCCVCQALSQHIPTNKPTTLQPTYQSACIDTPGYMDVYGDDCKYYGAEENYPQACQYFGETENAAGMTPNENCCVCEASLQTNEPTLQPTTSQPSPCTNTPGFVDTYGDGCGVYEADKNVPLLCTSYGNDGDAGMTPNENCCVCQDLLQTPTKAPTASLQHIVFQSSCIDTPGYTDAYGDDCDYYAANENYPQACQYFGETGDADDGMTPNENCCVCQALIQTTPSNTPTLVPTMQKPSTPPSQVPTIGTTDSPTKVTASPSTSSEPTSAPSIESVPETTTTTTSNTTSSIANQTATTTEYPIEYASSTPASIESNNHTDVTITSSTTEATRPINFFPLKWYPGNMGAKPLPWESEYIQCIYGDEYPAEYFTNSKYRDLMLFNDREECCEAFVRVEACRPTQSPSMSPTPPSGAFRRRAALVGIMAGFVIAVTCPT